MIRTLTVLMGVVFVGLVSGFPSGNSPRAFSWLLDSDSWGSTDPASIIPLETYSDCGGVIRLNESLDLTLVEYAPTNGIPARLRCVWPISTNFSHIEVYYDYFRLPEGSGLSFYYIDNGFDTAFNIDKVHPVDQTQHQFDIYDKLYLVLTSNSTAGRDGFRLGLRARTAMTPVVGFNVHHRNATGGLRSHSSGNYQNFESSSIVIQPPTACNETTVKITTMDTQAQNDFLNVYTMIPYHELVNDTAALWPSGRFSGYHPFGPANSTTTSGEPRLLTFETDHSIIGVGFTLEWACENQP